MLVVWKYEMVSRQSLIKTYWEHMDTYFLMGY